MTKKLIKRKQIFILMFILIPLLMLFILSGCDNTVVPPGADVSYTVLFSNGTTETSGDEVYDFGLVEAENGSAAVSVLVTNNSDFGITVSAVSVSDTTNYSLETPGLPGTVEAGQSGEYTLNFTPLESGTLSTEVSISIEGLGSPVTADVTGEGNFAPVPKFGITVSDAEIAGANGFYERNGFHTATSFNSTKRPLYQKAGTTTYYSYIYDASDADIWCIADIPDADYDGSAALFDVYPNFPDPPSPLSPPSSGWDQVSGGASSLTVNVQDISGGDPTAGVTLTADYLYFDAEDDPESAGSVSYQWYRADTVDGTYTAISGATANTYDTTVSDENKYIKVGITLTAESGITDGPEVLSSSTVKLDPMPG